MVIHDGRVPYIMFEPVVYQTYYKRFWLLRTISEGAGSFVFDRIKGSYTNVLGLPVGKLKELFDELGVDLLKA